MQFTNASIRRTLTCLVLAAAAVGLTACSAQKSKGHVKAVNEANNRWKQVRSGMVLQSAQRYFDAGDLDQAEKSLIEALSVDPSNPLLHILAGRIALERGQLERAFGRLETSIGFDDSIPAAYYFQGIVLQRWQRYEEAHTRYSKAYELEADNLAYFLAKIEMLVALDRAAEAYGLAADKIVYFDTSPGIRMAAGRLAIMLGEVDTALEYFDEASMLQPDDLQIKEELARLKIRLGRDREAISDLESLTSHPDMAKRTDLKTDLAAAYRRTGRLVEAKQLYLQLSRKQPRNASYWIELGEIAWSQNDTSGALLAGSRAMALAPDQPEGYLVAGLVWQKRGQHDRALQLFDRAAQVAPDNADALILRGISLQKSGNVAAAADAYSEALRRQPTDSRAKQLLAAVTADN